MDSSDRPSKDPDSAAAPRQMTHEEIIEKHGALDGYDPALRPTTPMEWEPKGPPGVPKPSPKKQ